jgi:hypothetical protein
MVHAVSHLGSRIQSPAMVKASPKHAVPAFANSLKSLSGPETPTALSTTTSPTSEPVAVPTPDTSLKALFGQPIPANPTPVAPQSTTQQAPTAESVFGPNPWMTAPTGMGPNGVTFSYNPIFFATPATAMKVAQMVGGTVIQSNQFTPNGGAFQQQQANWMVQMPNGNIVNPGLVASFYTHGYPQSYIDGLIAGAVNNT